jgi:membrane dipeptidase
MSAAPPSEAPPVFDAHCDTAHAVLRGEPVLAGPAPGHVDLPRLRLGGVRWQVFALWVEPAHKPERALARALQLWDAMDRAAAASGGALAICRTPRDLDAARRSGGVGAILGLEGAEAIGTDLATLRAWHALGLRVLGLTWNERNALADGAGEARAGGGLTRFGREVVAECNRLGIVVDASHLCERAFWDLLEVSRQPVIASHSNAFALCPHERNLRDAQIRALAAAGGVIGCNFFPEFLDPDPDRADVARVCDHIDAICSLAGVRHAGLGSDFDGIGRTPRGLEDCSRFPAVAEELRRRGYAEEAVRQILGGNFLRVFREVWGALPPHTTPRGGAGWNPGRSPDPRSPVPSARGRGCVSSNGRSRACGGAGAC